MKRPVDTTARLLEKIVEAKARMFACDPGLAGAAGYSPICGDAKAEENEGTKGHPDLAAWMIGIARRDLIGWDWRLDENTRASLVIIGPLWEIAASELTGRCSRSWIADMDWVNDR
jgi:hypothetical protein